jgi:hypothetical protein
MAPRRAASCFALAALLAVFAAPLHAVDYYVQEGGSDGADGLTPATAWASLVHAAEEVGPGDTVHVDDGEYHVACR